MSVAASAEPTYPSLRSLMDVLEAIVLYDKLVIDASSRTAFLEGEAPFQPAWADLSSLSDRHHKPILAEEIIFGEIAGQAALLAFDSLLRHLRSKTFIEALEGFRRADIDFVVPDFYRNADDFYALFYQGFPRMGNSAEVGEKLLKVRERLAAANIVESTYRQIAENWPDGGF